ncbi:MAG TPA: hypothetical protein PKC18_08690, partial [Lacipirellulaceae bacterium]|nr:hypothetical protein [Lacipirellulaceae bacterium]
MRISPLVSCTLLALAWGRVCWGQPWPLPHTLPLQRDLPDVLRFFDGTAADSADVWRQRRRPELL